MNRKMAFSIFSALFVICFVSLSGCHTVTAGKDFNSSARTEIVLDKTNKDEVIKLFGTPEKIETVSIKGLDYEQYYYDFVKGKIPNYFEHLRGIRPKKPYIRALSIDFKNDRVQNYQLFSTFPEEFITFDEGLIEKIIINDLLQVNNTILSLFKAEAAYRSISSGGGTLHLEDRMLVAV